MADMTWVEVRSAIQRGYTVAIVPSGGIEQNGAHMVLGKHDYIVRSAANRIARELGTHAGGAGGVVRAAGQHTTHRAATCSFPARSVFPNPCSLRVLEGIARSLKATGFKTICLVGDHGGNRPRKPRSRRSSMANGRSQGTSVLHVGDYYSEVSADRAICGERVKRQQ